MFPERTARPSAFPPNTTSLTLDFLTLEPLVSNGPIALAPDPDLAIGRAVLVQTVLAWHNAFNELTIRKADDLFACAAQDGGYYDLLPKGADLVGATLEVHPAGSGEPYWVELQPPRTVICTRPAECPRIVQFLARRGFTRS